MLKIKRYEWLEISHLLCVQCKKNRLHETLYSLESLLDKEENENGLTGIVIQIKEDEYCIYYDEAVCQKGEKCNNEFLRNLCIESAIKIRYEGSLREYEQEKEELEKVLNKNLLEKTSDSYCYILQADKEYDFMVMDIYVGVREKEEITL